MKIRIETSEYRNLLEMAHFLKYYSNKIDFLGDGEKKNLKEMIEVFNNDEVKDES